MPTLPLRPNMCAGTIEERLVGLLERKRADEVEAEADAFASTVSQGGTREMLS